MGNSSAEIVSASGLMIKAKVKWQKAKFIFVLTLFVCFAGNLLAQTSEQVELYRHQIQTGDEEAKRNALFELRNFETETASRIAVPALRDSSDIVRATATSTVIFLPEEEIARVLLPLLDDKSEFVRRETALALGNSGSVSAVQGLIKSLQTDKEPEVRAAAATALGEIGAISAIEYLTKILQTKPKKDNEFLRRSSARAIGNIARRIQRQESPVVTPESFLPEKFKDLKKPKYRRLVEAFPVFINANATLIKVLQNKKETSDVQREAAFALGEIGDISSIDVLKSKLNAQDYYLAEICEEALRKVFQNVNFSKSGG